jgi:hypothetical protein
MSLTIIICSLFGLDRWVLGRIYDMVFTGLFELIPCTEKHIDDVGLRKSGGCFPRFLLQFISSSLSHENKNLGFPPST